MPAPVCSVSGQIATPSLFQAAEERLAEVQPGGRRGDRPGPAGVDRLILPAIGLDHLALADVGRQGHAADSFQEGEGLFVALRADDPTAVALLDGQLKADIVLPPGHSIRRIHLAGHEFSAGLAEHSPHAALPGFQKQPLPMATRALAAAKKPGRHDLRVVEHEAVARAKAVPGRSRM